MKEQNDMHNLQSHITPTSAHPYDKGNHAATIAKRN